MNLLVLALNEALGKGGTVLRLYVLEDPAENN
jgi:hypothetical protein